MEDQEWGSFLSATDPAPAPRKPVSPPAARSKPQQSGSGWDSFLEATEPTRSAPAPEQKKPESRSWMTSSILGSDFIKTLDKVIPQEYRDSPGWGPRFASELYKAGPEALDFMTSPAGIGLVVAHMVPQTRAIAAIADYGLGMVQTKELLESVKKFAKDRSPENAAKMVSSLAFSYGALKAGGKKLEAGAPTKVSIPETEAIRGRIVSAGDEPLAKLSMDAKGRQVTEAKKESLKLKIEAMDEAGKTVPDEAADSHWGKQVAKMASKAYKYPIVRDIASMVNIPKSELLSVGSDIVRDRSIMIADQKLTVNRIKHAIKMSVPAEERKIYDTNPDGSLRPANKMAAVIQGTMTAEKAGLSPAARNAVEVIKNRNKERDALLKSFYGDDLSLLDPEKYLTQIWDFGEDTRGVGGSSRTSLRDRFARERRVIDDYQKGLEIGLKPKYNDILDVIDVREDHAIKAIANGRMANVLKEMGALITEDQKSSLGLDWKPLTDAPALYHATYVGTEVYKKGAAERANARNYRGEPMTTMTSTHRYQPVFAHPDIEQAVAAVFSKPWEFPGIKPIEDIMAFSKKMVLSASFFHQGALSEVSHAIQLMGQGMNKVERSEWLKHPTWPPPKSSTTGRIGQAVKQTWIVDEEMWRGLKSALWEVSGKETKFSESPPVLRLSEETVRDPIKHGLELNSEDRHAKVIQQMMDFGKNSESRAARIASAPVRLYGKLGYVLDRSLWDFYDQGQKLNAYQTIVARDLGKLGSNATVREIANSKRAAADFLNNAYGAINFERLLVHPKMRQLLHMSLLAPAWKIAQLRTVTQAFEGVSQRRLANQYVIKASIAWFAATQMFNYALSSYYGNPDKDGKKEAHFSWDNPGIPVTSNGKIIGTTNMINIAAGFNSDGRERYIAPNKAMRDTFMTLLHPIEEIKSSVHPVWRTVMQELYGRDPATGYQVIDDNASALEQAAQRLDVALQAMVPFSVTSVLKTLQHKALPEVMPLPSSPSQLWFLPGMPVRSGMTYKKAIDAYIDAAQDGDNARAVAILRMSELEHMNPKTIVRGYLDYIRKRQRNASGPRQVFDTEGRPQPPAARKEQ